nr:MAG TPA: hypothetical protein [Caudoviricetes sp.]
MSGLAGQKQDLATLAPSNFYKDITMAHMIIIDKHSNSLTLASAQVYKDAERNEYVVTFYRNGEKQHGADYHTDDRKDANKTAASFVTTIEA